MYVIRYGHAGKFKKTSTKDSFQANRMFDKVVSFAKKHNITWTVALWEETEKDRLWLVKSERVN